MFAGSDLDAEKATLESFFTLQAADAVRGSVASDLIRVLMTILMRMYSTLLCYAYLRELP